MHRIEIPEGEISRVETELHHVGGIQADAHKIRVIESSIHDPPTLGKVKLSKFVATWIDTNCTVVGVMRIYGHCGLNKGGCWAAVRVRGELVLMRRPGVRKGHRNAFPK